jgi:hypothetical protein
VPRNDKMYIYLCLSTYLEQSDYWSDFHNHLIAALAKD